MKPTHVKIMVIAAIALVTGTIFINIFVNENPKNIDQNIDYTAYDLLNFGSYEEYNSFLQNNSDSGSSYTTYRENEMAPTIETTNSDDAEKTLSGGDTGDYSSTNIQELGVDEPDIVKTDGTYLYVIANSTVFIIKAYPAEEATIITTIDLNESQTPRNLFIKDDRLAIITQSYLYRTYGGIAYAESTDQILEEDKDEDSTDASTSYDEGNVDGIKEDDYWVDTTQTQIIIYDISTKNQPVEIQNIQLEGYYSTARLIDDYIYVITTYYPYESVLYDDEESSYIPKISVNERDQNIGLTDIYYIDSPETSKTQTQITSINIINENEDVNSKVFILGNPSIIYVSLDSIFITSTYNNYAYSFIDEIMDEYIIPALPSEAKDEFDLVETLTLQDYQKTTVTEWIMYQYIDELDDEEKKEIAHQIIMQYEKTTIHKIDIDDGDISYTAQGAIPGYINNQFSMSEYDGMLRVATTVNGWMVNSYVSSIDSYNNVYILNETLDIIGEVEDIAEGETIYSARFMDSICYLVTYEQIDPFYVIDLQDPYNPEILGELKIPGYSTYLHPYDEDHIIGIGMEDNTIKINLFNVEDQSNPVTVDTYIMQENSESYYWMYSTALYEHKAFLFDKDKNLLIMPVSSNYIESAYVFNISTDGIILRGNISHLNEKQPAEETDPYEPYMSAYWKNDYRYSIVRSLYIDDVIYTFSDAVIQMNDMQTLDKINSIHLI